MRSRSLVPLLFALALVTPVAGAEKPAPGPAAGVAREQPKPEPPDDQRRREIEAQHLRDEADLLRAAYEKANRPGPVPEKAKQAFEEIVAAYRAAIDHDPVGPVATYCRQRLAGAYNYTRDFEVGLHVLAEAVTLASTPLERIEADHAVANHYLQAMHKPAEAIEWFGRAQAQLKDISDEQLRAKWTTALDQGIARCQAELAK